MKLKIVLLLCGFGLINLSTYAQSANFTITVKMSANMDGYKAFLYYIKDTDQKPTLDSVTYSNEKFEIKGKTLNPQRAQLYVERGNKGFKPDMTKAPTPIYLEKGDILVAGTRFVKDARLSGTPLNNDYQGYTDVLNIYKPKLDSLRNLFGKAYQEKNSAELSKLTPQFTALAEITQKGEEAYFYKHLNSLVSLDWLKKNLNIAQGKSKALAMFDQMGPAVKKSAGGKAYYNLLTTTSSVETGSAAPNFNAKNIQGENIALSSYRGKYVLLDFWASWCAPCRKENPNVVKAFNRYKEKNFTVLSFSMDDSKKAWEDAVKKDALPWAQISDLLAWEGPVSHLYGISGIPSNFLIDPQGKIVARDLRGEALDAELSKVLD